MNSFIENYCGEWKNDFGNRIVIKYKDDQSVLVEFYRSGENTPMIRPWYGDKPATSMLGTLDSETEATLNINLSDNTNSFCLNLSIDFIDDGYSSCTPSIIRLENEDYLEQYYKLLEPLSEYKKC